VSRSLDTARSPWATQDGLRAGVLVGSGAAACLVAWAAASGRAAVADQTGFVSLGVAGFLVAFAGEVSWVLRGRRAVGRRAVLLLGGPPQARSGWAAPRADELVAGAGLRLYHRADCRLAGSAWAADGRAGHEAAGRRPCGVCRP